MEIIVGALVSGIAQWLKSKTNLGGYKTVAMVAIVSLIASGIYTYLVMAGYWKTAAEIFLTAGAFYTYVIAQFEK